MFVDNDQQCFAFTPQANFPAHNLNSHWRWRWRDPIQAIFESFFYFNHAAYGTESIFSLVLWSFNILLWYMLFSYEWGLYVQSIKVFYYNLGNLILILILIRFMFCMVYVTSVYHFTYKWQYCSLLTR